MDGYSHLMPYVGLDEAFPGVTLSNSLVPSQFTAAFNMGTKNLNRPKDASGNLVYESDLKITYRPDMPPLDNVAQEVSKYTEKYSELKELLNFLDKQKAEMLLRRTALDSLLLKLKSQFGETENIIGREALANTKEMEEITDSGKIYLSLVEPLVLKSIYELSTKIQTLCEDISINESNLSLLSNFFLTSAKAIIPVDKVCSNMCPVCFDSQVDRVCVPCGHTICSACSTKTTGKCTLCRGSIDKVIKLYFSI